MELLEGWIAARATLTVAQLIDRVLQDTRYAEYLRDGSEEGEDRWANVLELRNVAAEYADLTLTDFLADVALVSDVDNLSDSAEAPTLLTLHAAKGLEFPVVFITGLEDGLLPHSRSFDDPEQMAEERRLSYVGLTRAKDQLVLTYAFMRPRYGDAGGYTREPSIPSRFLDDIPPQLINGSWRRTGHSTARQGVADGGRWGPVGADKPMSRSTDRPSSADMGATPAAPVQSRFRAGQRVRHATFGQGLVIESRPDRDDEMVTVLFEAAGLKRLLVSLAHLERLDG